MNACKTCGGAMTGDGYTEVRHCENVDVIGEGLEPDALPVHCPPEHCAANWEGDCTHPGCPQLRDWKPICPVPSWPEEG